MVIKSSIGFIKSKTNLKVGWLDSMIFTIATRFKYSCLAAKERECWAESKSEVR